MPLSVYVTTYECITEGCHNKLHDSSGYKRSWRSKKFCDDCLLERKAVASKRCRNKSNGKD